MAGSNNSSNQASWPTSHYPSTLEMDGEGSSSSSSNQGSNTGALLAHRNELQPQDYAEFQGMGPTTSTYSTHSKDPANPVPPQDYTQRQTNLANGKAPCGCRRG